MSSSFQLLCLFSDVVLEGNVETESSVSKSVEEKPPNTPDVSAQDAEAMANAMLLDSLLPNSKRGNEEVLEDGGSDKLPEEGEGGKLPEGGDDK